MTTTPDTGRLRTWSISGQGRRKLNEYDIVTGKFHYHFGKQPAPFDLDPDSAINQWYLRYREGSLAARAARKSLERELASYTSPGDLNDLDAILDRYSDEETADIRRILAARRYA